MLPPLPQDDSGQPQAGRRESPSHVGRVPGREVVALGLLHHRCLMALPNCYFYRFYTMIEDFLA